MLWTSLSFAWHPGPEGIQRAKRNCLFIACAVEERPPAREIAYILLMDDIRLYGQSSRCRNYTEFPDVSRLAIFGGTTAASAT